VRVDGPPRHLDCHCLYLDSDGPGLRRVAARTAVAETLLVPPLEIPGSGRIRACHAETGLPHPSQGQGFARLQPLRADVATHEQRLERLARGDNSASTLDRLADTEAELQAARTRLNTATREALVKLDKIARASGWTGPL